jgi:hypothetical protein
MRRWEDNIETDLKAVSYENVDWVHTAQEEHRLRGTEANIPNLGGGGK